MEKRMLVFLDLLDIVERMHFGEIAYEFLEKIIIKEYKIGNLTKNEFDVLKNSIILIK